MAQMRKTQQGKRDEQQVEEEAKAATEQTDREALLDEIDQVLEEIDECVKTNDCSHCPCGESFSECLRYDDDGTVRFPF